MKRIEINMTNNDVLKKLRIALNLKDTDILETLKLSGFEISKTELTAFFRKPDHRNYKECGDQVLRRFLDGLIIKMRGPRDKKKVRIVTRSKPYQGKPGKAPTKPD